MKIKTSYFYQIRNFTPNMIPVSTAISDPAWYRPKDGEGYYIDKRGIVCGLRYEPLIVQKLGNMPECIGNFQICPYVYSGPLKEHYRCKVLNVYEYLLYSFVDKEKTLKAFEYCANKFQKELGFKEEPIIVLMVYEAPNNPCSERAALQHFFQCKELRYPIEDNY